MFLKLCPSIQGKIRVPAVLTEEKSKRKEGTAGTVCCACSYFAVFGIGMIFREFEEGVLPGRGLIKKGDSARMRAEKKGDPAGLQAEKEG